MVEDFAYLNARVQARRASLLREAAFQEALDLSFPDFLRFLSETAYGKELAGEGLAQVDRAIARTQARLVGDLPRLVGGRVKQAVDLLLLRHDLHNLQTVLRAKATGQPLEEALLLPGALKEGLWPQVFAAPDPPAMAQVLAATGHPLAPALRAALRSAQDPLQVEVLLAKRFWEGALEVAETLRDPVLRDHLALEVDAENLRTALKLQGQGVRPEDLFVQGGRFVDRLRFARLLEGDGSVLDELAGTPFAPLAGARDLKELERRLRCVLLKEARKAAAEAEGLGPVLAYVREREWEAVRLRLLARRAYYGLPRAQVEGEVRCP